MILQNERKEKNAKDDTRRKWKLKEQLRERKGITLIALVITVIVLLIIASVTIGSLTSDKGVIKEARTAKELAEKASLEEQVEMAIIKAEQKHKNPTLNDVIKELIDSNVIKSEEDVDSEGVITTVLGYQIEGKLDDYIGKVSTGDNTGNTTGGGGNTVGGNTTGGGTVTAPSTDDTTPFVPEGTKKIEGTIDTGLIMTDANDNEWVWIEVPKSIYTNPEYAGTPPTSSEDYDKIESIMQKYAYAYKGNYKDEWYAEEQHGFESAELYNNHKKSMLKSVYENGGFYIGRYEAGTNTPRYLASDEIIPAKSQSDLYPYNFITCKKAQELATGMAIGGKTSSLMFCIQWDLVMKYIEEKGSLEDGTKVTEAMLKTNSSNWGNYKNVSFTITKGKYTANPSTIGSWQEAKPSYSKPSSAVLLKTGSTSRNSVLGIYDLAGNVCEWTLGQPTFSYSNWYPRTLSRGGAYNLIGTSNQACSWLGGSYGDVQGNNVDGSPSGFRATLW